ncbi:MAG: cation-transporting P-type ATPase [Lachnospiraceae bacterium]
MEKCYNDERNEVLEALNSDPFVGLTAEKVERRTAKFGKNEFDPAKKESLLLLVLSQLKDITTIILLLAVVLSFILAIREGHGYIEPVVILSIVIINVILAITQEKSAEKSLDALTNLNSPTCVVLRDKVR